MKPDVIVMTVNHTTLFQTQNQRVTDWLHRHFVMPVDTGGADTEIRVHPARCARLIEELRAAGFTVTESGDRNP